MDPATCAQGSEHLNKLLPEHFDANEWFLLISLCTIVTVAVVLPRRFPTIVTIVFLAMGLGISMYVDFLLAPPPLDLYDINDTKYYELFEIPFYYLYAPFAYVFVYFYDKWKVRGLWTVLYVAVWSTASTLFERFADYCHVFKYKGWNLGYSFVFYLAVQSLYLLLYYMVKSSYNRTKREDGPEWN